MMADGSLSENKLLCSGYELVFAGAVLAHELEEQKPLAQDLWRASAGKRADFMFEVRFSGDGAELRTASLSDPSQDKLLWADIMAATSKSGGQLMID
jgi:extradiol dioxygenase family protein